VAACLGNRRRRWTPSADSEHSFAPPRSPSTPRRTPETRDPRPVPHPRAVHRRGLPRVSAFNATQSTLIKTHGLELLDVERAHHNLSFATHSLSARMVTIDALSRRLLGSQLLFIRTRGVPPCAEIIHKRAGGRLIVALSQDVPRFVNATLQAREHVAELIVRAPGKAPLSFGHPGAGRAIAGDRSQSVGGDGADSDPSPA